MEVTRGDARSLDYSSYEDHACGADHGDNEGYYMVYRAKNTY